MTEQGQHEKPSPITSRPDYYFAPQAPFSDAAEVYDSPPSEYEATFREVLDPGETLTSICKQLRNSQGYVFGADIMGGAGVYRTLPVDGAVGITSNDIRDDATKLLDEQAGIEVREGNVLRPATWRVRLKRAVQALQRKNPKIKGGINLMLIRPFGGAAGFPDESSPQDEIRGVTPDYLQIIGGEAINNVVDGGTFFAEVPRGLVGRLPDLQKEADARGWRMRTGADPVNRLYPKVVRIDKPLQPVKQAA